MHPDCERFEELIQIARERDLSDKELDFWLKHEENCPSGEHTEEGLEKLVGLPPGTLKHGSPDHGIPSDEEMIRRVLERINSEEKSS